MSASWSSWWGACSPRVALSSLVPALRVPRALMVGRHFPTISIPRSLCYVHRWSVLTRQKPCASGPEPPPVKSPAQRAPPHGRPAALTGLHRAPSIFASISQMWWPSARKGARSLLLCPDRAPPRNHTWMQADGTRGGNALTRGSTLARPAHQQPLRVGRPT